MSQTEVWPSQSQTESNFQPAQSQPETWPGQEETWGDQAQPQATAPSSIPSPTPYMSKLIDRYAGKDPNLAWFMQKQLGLESSGGTNVINDPNGGAQGPFQIKPGTAKDAGFDPSQLQNPDYNTAVAAALDRKYMLEYHGNRVKAALAYKEGEGWVGTPFEKLPAAGRAYVKSIADAIAAGDNSSPEAQHLIAHGSDQVQTPKLSLSGFGTPNIFHSPLYRHLVGKPYAMAKEELDLDRRNPAERFFDALSSGQRAIDSLATTTVNTWNESPFSIVPAPEDEQMIRDTWAHPIEAIQKAYHGFVTPQDHEKIVHSLEAGVAHSLGFTDYRPDINHPADMIHHIAQFGADLGVDIVTPGGFGLFGTLSKGIKMTGAAHYSAGMTKLVADGLGKNPTYQAIKPQIDEWVKQSKTLVDTSKKVFEWLDEKRPELTNFRHGKMWTNPLKGATSVVAGFVKQGKLARMAIENAATYRGEQGAQEDVALLRKYESQLKDLKYGQEIPLEIMRHLLMMPWKYGDLAARDEAMLHLANLGMKPTEQELKDHPQAGELFSYEGSIQDDFIKAILPKGQFLSHVSPEVIEAAKWLRENAPSAGIPFTKTVTHAVDFPPGPFKAAQPLSGLPGAAQKKLTGQVQEGWKPNDIDMRKLIQHTLTVYREAIHRESIADETAKLYRGMKMAGVAHNLIQGIDIPAETVAEAKAWFSKNVQTRSSDYTLNINGDRTVGKMLRGLANYWKLGITWNPLPHGLINMFATTLFRAGPHVAGKGLRYALGNAFGRGGGVPEKLDKQMELYGIKSSYWKDPSDIIKWVDPTWLWNKATHMGSQAPAKSFSEWYFRGAQQLMDHLETGYRAALYEHINQTVGTLSKDDPHYLLNELMKAQMVNEQLGDYVNPTRLVSFTKALGGLYNTFRLKVVPGAAFHALVREPAAAAKLAQANPAKAAGRIDASIKRVLALGSAQHEFSDQFTPRQNEELFGPYSDESELLFDTRDYLTSTATLGPVFGGQEQALRHENNRRVSGFQEDVWNLLRYVLPGSGALDEVRNPYHRDTAPTWVRVFVEAGLGGHGIRKPKPKTVMDRRREYNKAANR